MKLLAVGVPVLAMRSESFPSPATACFTNAVNGTEMGAFARGTSQLVNSPLAAGRLLQVMPDSVHELSGTTAIVWVMGTCEPEAANNRSVALKIMPGVGGSSKRR